MQTTAASASSEHTTMATNSSRRTQTSQPPRLLDQVRHIIRMKHMRRRTEEAYVSYIRQFILFHNKRHPKEMGVPEIRAYLSHLAVERNVAASTQNVALSAQWYRPPPSHPGGQHPAGRETGQARRRNCQTGQLSHLPS
jgi:hypothetical protein